MTPILSILTPAVPSRMSQVGEHHDDMAIRGSLQNLIEKIELFNPGTVEHLIFCDNKMRTVGEKRDALLRMARGQYVAFVDDDDDVSHDYVAEILNAAKEDPDVITFLQSASVDGMEGTVQFRLGNPNGPFHAGAITLRNAWHVCAWRRTLAIQSHFPAVNYGEDWQFAAPLCALPNLREVHIPKVLHYYRHSSETTEAPPPQI